MGPGGKDKAGQSTSDQQRGGLEKNSPSRPFAPTKLTASEPPLRLPGRNSALDPALPSGDFEPFQ